MTAKQEKAVACYLKEFNCAQAVLIAFCEESGLDTTLALKIASGFGSGLRQGGVCGAASGAAMVIGLWCGHTTEGDKAQKNYCNQKTLSFLETFAAECGNLTCCEFMGYDVYDEAVHLANKAKRLEICPPLVAKAVEILEMMEKEM